MRFPASDGRTEVKKKNRYVWNIFFCNKKLRTLFVQIQNTQTMLYAWFYVLFSAFLQA